MKVMKREMGRGDYEGEQRWLGLALGCWSLVWNGEWLAKGVGEVVWLNAITI